MPERIPTFEESIMPRSTIKACARTVLHAETSIKKEALTALAKGSSVFISYLTTHANEIAFSKKRKTIMPADVFEALKVIEFERFVADLRETYEQTEAENKAKKERNKSAKEINSESQEFDAEHEDESMPPSKRSRVENGDDSEMHESSEPGEEEEGGQEEEDEDEDEDDEDEADDDEEAEEGAEDVDDSTAVNQLGDDVQERNTVQEDDYDEVLDDGEDSD